MPNEAATKQTTRVDELREIIEQKLQAIRQTNAEILIVNNESREDLEPLRRRRNELEVQVRALNAATPERLREMGLASRKLADNKRRGLEDDLAQARAKLKEREMYWSERGQILNERQAESRKAIEDAEAELKLYPTASVAHSS